MTSYIFFKLMSIHWVPWHALTGDKEWGQRRSCKRANFGNGSQIRLGARKNLLGLASGCGRSMIIWQTGLWIIRDPTCWEYVEIVTYNIPWRIHGAAIYGVPWIPSIYPSHVSINIPAPWIRHGYVNNETSPLPFFQTSFIDPANPSLVSS